MESARQTSLKNDVFGAVLLVGDNGNGQLGFQEEEITEKTRLTIADIAGAKSFLAIACGSMHSAVITCTTKHATELLTAGCGDDGQLGRLIPQDFNAERSFQRATIHGMESKERIIAVSCSDNATFALSDNGRLFATGSFRDRNGKFKLTSDEERRFEFSPLPIPVPNNLKLHDSAHKAAAIRITQVATGGNFVLLLTTEGNVLTFGVGECGELGRLPCSERLRNRVSRDCSLTPSPIDVPVGLKFDRVYAGEFTAFARVDLLKSTPHARAALGKKLRNHSNFKRRHDEAEVNISESPNAKKRFPERLGSKTAARKATVSQKTEESSVLYVFGLNNRGQMTLSEPLSEVHKPSAVYLPFLVEKVAAGQHHTLFLDSNGYVYAVGRPEYGRLGLKEQKTDVVGIPRRIDALPYAEAGGCIDVAATIENSFVVMRNGSAYSFGAPNSVLGLGYSNDDDHEPEYVPVLMRSKAVNEHDLLAVWAGSQHALFAACAKSKVTAKK